MTITDRFMQELDQLALPAKLIVACSGGLDSVALVALLGETWHHHQRTVAVAHINHGLRPQTETAQDFKAVSLVARRYDFDLSYYKIDANFFASGTNTEQKARTERYHFLDNLLKRAQDAVLLTAHTYNDQSETVFMRLQNFSGLTGLKGIPRQTDSFRRPLLNFTKAELKSYLEQKQFFWHEDSTNSSLDFKRNRVRAQITELEQMVPQLKTYLHHLGSQANEAVVLLNFCLKQLEPEIIYEPNRATISYQTFMASPTILQHEILYHFYDRLMHGKVDKDYRLPKRFLEQLNYYKQYPVLATGHGVRILKKKDKIIMEQLT